MLLCLEGRDEVVHMHLRFGGHELLDAEEGEKADAHLVETARRQLRAACEAHGVAGVFRALYNRPGDSGDELRVLWKAREPCPRCNQFIKKLKSNGRGTFICPDCQKLRKRRAPRSKMQR